MSVLWSRCASEPDDEVVLVLLSIVVCFEPARELGLAHEPGLGIRALGVPIVTLERDDLRSSRPDLAKQAVRSLLRLILV